MVKVRIEMDEWWPVYGLEDVPAELPRWPITIVELDDDLVARYRAAKSEWLDVQDILKKKAGD